VIYWGHSTTHLPQILVHQIAFRDVGRGDQPWGKKGVRGEVGKSKRRRRRGGWRRKGEQEGVGGRKDESFQEGVEKERRT